LPYLVKWKMTEAGQVFQSAAAYLVPVLAIDFACTVLKREPREIWIEGPGRVRIERATIFRSCQDQGPQVYFAKTKAALPRV
jgi:hypothetical protein